MSTQNKVKRQPRKQNKINHSLQSIVEHQKQNAIARDVKAKTQGQQLLIDRIDDSDIIFACGPAGTGKTYIAIIKAVNGLQSGKYKKIILTRPAVEAGEKIGYLPGDLKEKLDPYMMPLYDALSERVGNQQIQNWLFDKTIEICPVGFLRGRTLKDAFIVVDEAQNTTVVQLKMIITRLGFNSKMVITGDPTQNDLPNGQSGFIKIINALNNKIPKISVVELGNMDIIRHETIKNLLPLLEKVF